MKTNRLLNKMLFRIAAYAGIAFCILCFLLFFLQGCMVYQPSKAVETDPRSAGMEFEEVWLVTSDIVRIHAWFVPARNASRTILFCHGNAGNISHRLHSISVFNRLGCNVLIFDYRGYGKSDGSPSEKGTYLDADAAYGWLMERGIQEKDIVVFGRSLGGAVAAETATGRNPGGLILESTFSSVPDMGAKLYPFLPVRLLCRIRYDTLSKMDRIKCPVLVVHSPDDEMIPFSMGRRMYDAANEPKSFLQIRGSHNEGYFISSPEYENGLGHFILQDLTKAPPIK